MVPPESGPGTRAISGLGFIPGIQRLDIPDLQISDSVEGISGAGREGALCNRASFSGGDGGDVGSCVVV